MEWISIKDKLPKDYDTCEFDYVLVIAEESFPTQLIGLAQYRDNQWEIVNEAGIHSCTGLYPLESKDITHWMKIPLVNPRNKICDGKLIQDK